MLGIVLVLLPLSNIASKSVLLFKLLQKLKCHGGGKALDMYQLSILQQQTISIQNRDKQDL